MMRRLPLRSRLALLSAVAVAVAIAGVSLISWIAVRDRLYQQLDKSIENSGAPHSELFHVPPPDSGMFIGIFNPEDPCANPTTQQLPKGATLYAPPPLTNVTLVTADGVSCSFAGDAKAQWIRSDLTAADFAPDKSIWRSGTTTDGQRVRIQVVSGRIDIPGSVFLKWQPSKSVDDSLSSLAWLLLGVSVLGVAGAATTGLVVARAALRPVDHLTEAVEHVARTEDLTVRMPVSGDDEIARLSASFNAMTAALQASRDEQKRLVDDAGHELRTPLTSLRTTIDLLIRSEESGRPLPEGKRSELLSGARTQMRELTVLIADLLELSRPEQAATAVASPVALHEVVEQAIERVRPRGLAREVPVTIRADLGPWITHGDAAALERAVVNLLDNAVKFSPPGETVDVVLTNGTLTVRDRGPGIPAEELPHVFERFWRSPSARAMPGSGLGLAIAARVAREAGGEISLGPAMDGGPGTVARLVLPGTAGQAAS